MGNIVYLLSDELKQIGYSNYNIDLKRFSGGVYYIRLITKEGTINKKFIIIK
jgi:hypothetical protein